MQVSEEFTECETCRAKPGSPILCASCLHNRTLISRLQWELKKKIPLSSLSLIRTAELIWPLMLAQETGEISEAKVAEIIGKDIVSLRQIKASSIKAIVDLLESLPSPLILLLESTKGLQKLSTKNGG